MKGKIKIKKTHLLILGGIVLLGVVLAFIHSSRMVLAEKAPSTEELGLRYNLIKGSPLTGSCGARGPAQMEQTFQGACCGEMTEYRYVRQITYIYEHFGKVEEIPKDPWNVSSDIALRFSEYDRTTTLNSDEQEVYDEALELFDEGPCCCRCWRWFTFDGMAKFLIKEKGFNAEQIAYLWASEDVCGNENPYEEIGDDD